MVQAVHQLVDRVFHGPGILQLRTWRFRRLFAKGHHVGVCDGVYETYEQACRAAPKSLPLGYDHPGPAAMYGDRVGRIYPGDYPMLHWLAKAFAEGHHAVFDLGGHTGVSYYAYQKYLGYPDGLTWRVCDVPAVVEAGMAFAAVRDESRRLGFTSSYDDGDGVPILFTSGCLQYLPQTLEQIIRPWKAPPTWVLVNLLPLHERHEYWTVQNIGSAFCPYRIQRHDAFFAKMEGLGYQRLDSWENPEKKCEVRFEPTHSLDRYYGAAFRRP